jgi:CheY-like chemotaxis protein
MRTVLLVDDSAVSRRVLGRALAAAGYTLVEVDSMRAAVRADVTRVDCAILDLELGDGDGTAVASAIRARRPGLPVVFFTTGTTPSLVEAARSQGPVFLKPDVAPVVAWVKRAIGNPSQPPPTK